MNRKDVALDLNAVQDKLAQSHGKTFWRSLEELADTPAFQEMLHREFPENATEWGGDSLSRRRFLTLMGASLALAGLSGCSKSPNEKILPYVIQPEGILPSKPQFYASAISLGRHVTGVLVESHMGRPTKIEGNPDHPGSLGATDVFAQADILSMYDPDREGTVMYLGRTRIWEDAFREISLAVEKAGGAGVRILTETITSPTLATQLQSLLEFKKKDGAGKEIQPFQGAKVVVHEATEATAEAAAIKASFNEDLTPIYDLEKADIIVSLDADFLCGPGAGLRQAREFGKRRRIDPTEPFKEKKSAHGVYQNDAYGSRLNRLYVLESMMSPTGSLADHRLALKPTEIEAFARALAAKLGVEGVADADNPVATKHKKFLDALVGDLTKLYDDEKKEWTGKRDEGTTLIIPGAYQSAAVHQLAHAINAKLGNLKKTVTFVEPAHKLPLKAEQTQTLDELIADMKAGSVKVLLILGGNPVYTLPPAMGFEEALKKVELRVNISLFANETSAQCHWHLPRTHPLEEWSDARTFDGTATIVQPLIAPLHAGRSAHEILAGLGSDPSLSGRDVVKTYWQKWYVANKANLKDERSKESFDLFWKKTLRDGVIEASAFKAKDAAIQKVDFGKLPRVGDYEVVFQPDPALFDGRYANNGWMQEFPKPITKITWDNVAHMSPATAEKLGIKVRLGARGGEHGETYIDRVKLKVDGREILIPAWIVPGHAEGCISLTLGYGRQRAGRVALSEERKPVGVDVNPLRKHAAQWSAEIEPPTREGGRHLVACTQAHHSVEGRDLVRTVVATSHYHEDHFHYSFEIHRSGHHGGHGHDPHGAEDPHHHDEGKEKKAETPADPANPLRKPLDTLLPAEEQQKGYQRWGMVINLGACTGCSACVIACQAENNIPVVGKDQVNRGREMHWLRIDRYYATDSAHPEEVETYHQPMPCQQCEKAPCEQVCPVSATVHSDDGLNDMVYNRCVGTRYCSNNCPYKVRRFNFFGYQDYADNSLKLLRNPEVTVRTRGVMEKCTYCVQRIRAAEIEARRESRLIRDGEVVTACQAVCATGAITFGDLGPKEREKEPTSTVGKLSRSAINYTILDELNTFPRTSYLAAIRNPNPALVNTHDEKKG